MTHRNKVLVSGLASIVLYCIIFYFLPVIDRTLINLLGVTGFLLSMLGIVIAYFQILSIKEIAKITQDKIKETQDKIQENITIHSNILMVSDLSRKGAMIHEIQGYLLGDKIEMCVLRMKDLKVILISLKSQSKYTNFVKKEEFKTSFDNFNINLDNLQRHHFQNSKIDLVKINKDLEALSTLFLSVEHNIKKQQ